MSTFLKERRTLGIRMEDTPYTAESYPASTDFNGRFSNVDYDEDIQKTARKLARGDLSLDQIVIGKRAIKIKFRAEIYAADSTANGSSTTTSMGIGAPMWMAPMQACGASVQAVGGPPAVWQASPSSANTNTPCTIWIQEMAESSTEGYPWLLLQAHGCMGNAKIVNDKVGSFAYVEYEFTGAFDGFNSRGDNFLTSGITETNPAIPVLSSAITKDGYASGGPTSAISLYVDKVSLTFGNKVELYTNINDTAGTGYFGAHVTNRDPSAECDPDMQLSSDDDVWSAETSPIVGQFAVNFGVVSITCPEAQIDPPAKVGEREGHLTRQLKLRLNRGTDGDDEILISAGFAS